MKQYVSHKQLRLIGKGWEIRHQLRKILSTADGATLLAEFTSRRPSKRNQPGSVHATSIRKMRAWRKLNLTAKKLL